MLTRAEWLIGLKPYDSVRLVTPCGIQDVGHLVTGRGV